MPKIMTISSLFLVGIYIALSSVSAYATELHKAAKRGDVADITRLLDSGADIEFIDDEGDSSLHVAARVGHSEAIAMLLDGAQISRPEPS